MPSRSDLGEGRVDIAALEYIDVELPGVIRGGGVGFFAFPYRRNRRAPGASLARQVQSRRIASRPVNDRQVTHQGRPPRAALFDELTVKGVLAGEPRPAASCRRQCVPRTGANTNRNYRAGRGSRVDPAGTHNSRSCPGKHRQESPRQGTVRTRRGVHPPPISR